MSTIDLHKVDRIIARVGATPDAVIPILQAIQDEFHYLPPEALAHVCTVTEVHPSAVLGVSTFYDQFRHQPCGKHLIRVCHGTACHVKGAELTQEAIERALNVPDGDDTDPTGAYTIEPVACLGCCTLAPVVQIDESIYSGQTSGAVESMLRDFERRQQSAGAAAPATPAGGAQGTIKICLDSCCVANGCDKTHAALAAATSRYRLPVIVERVGCVSMCHRTPMVKVVTPGGETVVYDSVTAELARSLVDRHFTPTGLWQRLRRGASNLLDVFAGEAKPPIERREVDARDPGVCGFMGRQRHVVTEHLGRIDPLDYEAYIQHDGMRALNRCLDGELTGDEVIHTVVASGLRGRGGGGFPVGRKWQIVRDAPSSTKYVVCNGDEGDPGAFMDRVLLESFPYRVIEGVCIAAFAVGAAEAVFYIRAEYPKAVTSIRHAIDQVARCGLLDRMPTPNGEPFTLTVRQGAGAFVCGEETALIASLEGKRGMPRRRPPYPSERGLDGQPTLVNNVETLANLPWLLRNGCQAFKAIGTPCSPGTKVFSLAGKVKRGGLIEVPTGITVRQVVDEVGGGVGEGRTFKAVQIGGPSGGCLPASLADTPIDFDALQHAGAIMGSGGLVVLDDTDCMVDLARYFLSFTQDQSCGKCTFCRVGTRRMLDILDRICAGEGRRGDLEVLEQLSQQVMHGSLCGLGATAPNPVLSTLRYFRDEYEAHLEGRCPAGRCKALIDYRINDNCIGCTICAQNCPADAIALTPYQPHVIDEAKCTRCDVCRGVCPHDAVDVVSFK